MSLIDDAVVRGDGNEGSTAVKHYKRWSASRGERCLRPLDPLSTALNVKRREILRVVHFALFLVRDLPVAPKTASAYISTINAWHVRRSSVGLAAGASLSLKADMLKGYARTHPPPRGVFCRIGITPQHLAKGMDLVLGARGRCSPANQNLRACLTVSFSGLLRGCESCKQDGKRLDFQCLPNRKAVKRIADGGLSINIREAKRTSLSGVAPVASTPVQFFPGGKILDPVAEMEALLQQDPATADDFLFRNPVTKLPLSVAELRATVKAVAQAAGLDPRFFGAHSLRCNRTPSFRFTNFPPPHVSPFGRPARWGAPTPPRPASSLSVAKAL